MKSSNLLIFFQFFLNCSSEVWAAKSTTVLTNNGFPINFLENIVNSPIVQRKLHSRWKWEVWDIVPGTHSYKVYIFNITNPHDAEKGGKPILKQLGPYHYSEKRLKFDVSINLDLTVNYERNYTYTFNPSLSKGTEDDLVSVPNLPLIIFSTIASEVDPVKANLAVNDLVARGESLISKGVRVGDLLFEGMDVSKYQKYLDLLGNDTSRSDLLDEFHSGRYGIFAQKLGAHEHPYVINSGLIDKGKVGKIESWNFEEKLKWWRGDRCNAINGSDSSTFPPYPFLSQKASPQVLDLDLCRSISFQYSKDMMFHDKVQGLTFNIADNTLEDPAVYGPNSCFCKGPGPETCLKKGVLDVSTCRGGAPFIMSYAHFYNANPEYLKAVDGLKPDSAEHATQIDVEPITGAVINYRKKYQWNIWLKPLPQIDYFRTVNPIIFPVIWNDDTFHLNPDKAQLLEEELANLKGGVGDLASELANQLNGGSHLHMQFFNALGLIIVSITSTSLLSFFSSL